MFLLKLATIWRRIWEKYLIESALSGVEQIHSYLISRYATKEAVGVMLLCNQNRLLTTIAFDHAQLTALLSVQRKIVRVALEINAAKLVLFHNLPFGLPLPSQSDYELTDKVADVCSVLGLTFHEHVIVSGVDFYSFMDSEEDHRLLFQF